MTRILISLSLAATLVLPALAAEPSLPVLLAGGQATYPAEALELGMEGSVLLELLVDEDGTVADAVVVEPAGSGFDEAALEAVRTFTFEPARDEGGVASFARILYRYAFDLEAEVVTVDVPLPGPSPEPEPEPVEEVEDVYEIVVTERRDAPEISERVLSTAEIRYLPGTSGDVVRVVQNLPGVGRAPLNIGQLIVRGTAPEDTAYYLDGARIPLVFHFSGLSTVVNGDMLEEVSLVPGGYGPRYGRTLGGVVDLRVEDEVPERARAYASVDLYQSTAYAQQPVGSRTAVFASGRRSYADFILNPILGKGAATFQAPRYWDLQLRALHDGGRAGTFDATLLLSDDRFKFVGGEEGDEAFRIGLRTSFQKVRLRWERDLPGSWQSRLSLTAGPDANTFEFTGDGEAYERSTGLSLRQELGGGIGGTSTLRVGLDLLAEDESFRYAVPQFGDKEEGRARWISPAVYAEPTVGLGALRLSPGVRVDPLLVEGGYQRLAVDPRLGLTLDLGPTTRLEASSGLYSQPPTLRQILAEGGTEADLGFSRAWQSSAGVEQDLSASLTAEATAFVSELDDLVVGREDRFAFFTGPPATGPLDGRPYANAGTGRVLGAEAQVRLETERTVAWVAATATRSTRVDRDGEERLFRYDQPLFVTALGSTELGRGWRLGSRVRAGSGYPYTPVNNRLLLLDDQSFAPVYGDPDSERVGAFFSLDLRVDKEWQFERWSLSAYLDLQNATNTQNPEVMAWTSDFSEESPITSLPILPAFGFRGEI